MAQIELVVPDDLESVFTNRLLIRHSKHEVIVDAVLVSPDLPAHRVRGRWMMSPVTAKALLQALRASLDAYEATYGTIHLPDDMSLAEGLFGRADDGAEA